MHIDDEVIKNIRNALLAGMISLEDTVHYYNMINDSRTADFLINNECATSHFKFLREVLNNPILSMCPQCGHHNSNIECPIIRCEYCDHEFKINTKNADKVCDECVAFKTKKCNKKPNNDKGGKNNYGNE